MSWAEARKTAEWAKPLPAIDGKDYILSFSRLNILQTIDLDSHTVNAMATNDTNQIVAGHQSGILNLYDIDLQEVRLVHQFSSAIHGLEYLSGSKYLVVVGYKELCTIDVSTGEIVEVGSLRDDYYASGVIDNNRYVLIGQFSGYLALYRRSDNTLTQLSARVGSPQFIYEYNNLYVFIGDTNHKIWRYNKNTQEVSEVAVLDDWAMAMHSVQPENVFLLGDKSGNLYKMHTTNYELTPYENAGSSIQYIYQLTYGSYLVAQTGGGLSYYNSYTKELSSGGELGVYDSISHIGSLKDNLIAISQRGSILVCNSPELRQPIGLQEVIR